LKFSQEIRGARSSKTLLPQEDGSLDVFNEIDGTFDEFASVEELLSSKRSNVGRAVREGAFYAWPRS
jgi:hypothetical protein